MFLYVAIFSITSFNEIKAEALENYCHDEQANLQWISIETKAGVHPDLVELSKYRTELCQKIDVDEMPHEEAVILFEIERERVLERLKARRF